MSGRKSDVNIEGAFLHMAADAAVSVGVLVAGGLIAWKHWHWIDPTLSLIIVAAILWGTWDLLRKSVNLAMDAVPLHIDPEKVREYLNGLQGVTAVHDLHIWAMSTTETALTAHLVRPDETSADDLLHCASHDLHERFHIGHVTLQVERGNGPHVCKLESDEVV
jgi:cobalt-zinc-cadmium efflux system protein